MTSILRAVVTSLFGLGLGLGSTANVAGEAQSAASSAQPVPPVIAAGAQQAAQAMVSAQAIATARSVVLVEPSTALTTRPDPRWDASFAAFTAADQARAPAAGGIVFVGSSSIRMWDGLESEFGAASNVIKRGFGGSRMQDCASNVERLVTPYKPRIVVVYAGDNDLAEGRSPTEVLDSVKQFVSEVREDLPDTRIAYISIKPSPSRQSLLPHMREANTLIQNYLKTVDNTDYIDIFTPMLGGDGVPRPELFGADKLHMNPSGYALWKNVIAAYLQ